MADTQTTEYVDLARIAYSFGNASKNGDGYKCRCPLHDDNKASCSVLPDRSDPSNAIFTCFIGCNGTDIKRYARDKGLMPGYGATAHAKKNASNNTTTQDTAGFKLLDTYEYTDVDGKPLYRRFRARTDSNPKFFYYQYLYNGIWTKAKHVPVEHRAQHVLWRLPQVRAAALCGEAVLICEGEKDVKTAERGGLVATTGGSGSEWSYAWTESLRGAICYCVPDCDDTGYFLLNKMGESFKDLGMELRYIELGLDWAQDLTDWVEINGPDSLPLLFPDAKLWTKPVKCPLTKPKKQNKQEVEEKPKEKSATTIDNNVVAMPQANFQTWIGEYNDWGNSQRLSKLLKDRYIHVKGLGWFKCENGIWKEGEEAVYSACVEAIDALAETGEVNAIKWARDCRSRSRINAAIELAEKQESLRANVDMLDSNHHLLNCINCVVDLRTGKVVDRRADQYHTMQANAHYDEAFLDPEVYKDSDFYRMIEYATGGDDEMINFIRISSGYWITGETGLQAAWYFYGKGSNSKSTILETISMILGSYSATTPAEMWLKNRFSSDSHSSDPVHYRGKRLLLPAELAASCTLDEAFLKQWTGGQKLMGRNLYEKPMSFHPTGKPVFQSNDMVKLAENGHATWRRLHALNLPFIVPKHKRVLNYHKILANKEPCHILGFLVSGAMDFYANEKLPECEKMSDFNKEYRSAMDVLGTCIKENFMDKRADEYSGSYLMNCKEFYKVYTSFCEQGRFAVENQRVIKSQMLQKGFEIKERNDREHWIGLQLKVGDVY